MTDTDINPSNPIEEKLSAGKILAAARRRQNLSLGDAAQHLKLGIKQLEALEADDYDKLPGRTFVRGFIRNYAKLLQIDAEPLLDSCPIEAPQQLRTVETTIGEIPSPYASNKIWIKYSIAAIVILICLGSAALLLMRHESKPTKKPIATITQPKSPAVNTVPMITDKPQLPPTISESIAEKAPTVKNEVTTNVTPESITVEPISLPSVSLNAKKEENNLSQSNISSNDPGILQFFFNEEAWVEVTDASNKVIFYQLNPAGVRRIVRGQPPLQVVVGNAANVTMTYNNKPINLTPHIKVEVARLTLP